jgi:hypothetical protein
VDFKEIFGVQSRVGISGEELRSPGPVDWWGFVACWRGSSGSKGLPSALFFPLLLKDSRSVGVKSGRKIWYGWCGAIISRDELFLSPFSDFPLSGK